MNVFFFFFICSPRLNQQIFFHLFYYFDLKRNFCKGEVRLFSLFNDKLISFYIFPSPSFSSMNINFEEDMAMLSPSAESWQRCWLHCDLPCALNTNLSLRGKIEPRHLTAHRRADSLADTLTCTNTPCR